MRVVSNTFQFKLLILIVTTFSNYTLVDAQEFQYKFPMELVEGEVYLIDTLTIDTLYMQGFEKSKLFRGVETFAFSTEDEIILKYRIEDYFCSDGVSLIVDNTMITSFLWTEYVKSLDTINTNDPSIESKLFYEMCINNTNPNRTLEAKYIKLEGALMILNQRYHVFIIRGNVLKALNSNFRVNLNEYFNNIYFKVLAPI